MRVLKNITTLFFTVAVAGVFLYVYGHELGVLWQRSVAQFFPCVRPITYSLGTFDPEFGISKERFLKAVSDAEAIWEKPIGRELFEHTPDGYLKVNLEYDYRQETTEALGTLGSAVDENKASYDALKGKYESLVASYERDLGVFESRTLEFEKKRVAYEAEVSAANRKRRVSKEEYDRLQALGDALEAEVHVLNEEQSVLQRKLQEINTMVPVLNQLVSALNLKVSKYNTLGKSLGGEFSQGVYESDESGQDITIYQFDDYAKLVRVLAHELGHALYLEHLDNPKAIMYRLNQGLNAALTEDDLSALKTQCGIQ